MPDFGKWIVEVAVNGVKSGSFDRACDLHDLGFALHRAGAGNHGEMSAADFYISRLDNAVVGVGCSACLLIGRNNASYAFHNIHAG